MAIDPKSLASLRKTERMGTPRDTVEDPPRSFEPEAGPSEPRPAVGPRGTMVVSGGSSKVAKEPPSQPQEKAVAGQVVIGVGRAPKAGPEGKVDVSRVDPRRAPTRKLDRRPEHYLPPDKSLRKRSKSKPISFTTIGVVLVVLLALCALVLGVLVFLRASR